MKLFIFLVITEYNKTVEEEINVYISLSRFRLGLFLITCKVYRYKPENPT